MWWSTKPKSLPESSGPFVPGMTDIMLGYEKNGVFLRLYYPTNAKKGDPENEDKLHPWVPDYTYIQGFGNVVRHTLLIRLAFWWSNTNIIPALYGAKVKTGEKLKCIIMSHGLGGTRFAYSNICCELASHGFLVAAMEHRDQSACSTYFYKSEEDVKDNQRTIIPYLFLEVGKHQERRNEQAHYRAEECCSVVEFLQKLNEGVIPKNILDDNPHLPPIDFKLNDLVGRLDTNSFGIAGHSFGGTTSLLTLEKHPELKFAILLDPWMFPIEGENLADKIKHPLLFINTHTFYWEENVKAINEFLIQENRKAFTILHTTHENQSDSPLVMGYRLSNWFMKKLDPLIALRINNSLVVDFLNELVGVSCDIKHCKEVLNEENQNFVTGLRKP